MSYDRSNEDYEARVRSDGQAMLPLTPVGRAVGKTMTPDTDLDSKPMIRIVCAAIFSHSTGKVVKGVRHRFIREEFNITDGTTEGFVTNQNKFVTREEAWHIAEAVGQIINKPLNPGSLSSEDIY